MHYHGVSLTQRYAIHLCQGGKVRLDDMLTELRKRRQQQTEIVYNSIRNHQVLTTRQQNAMQKAMAAPAGQVRIEGYGTIAEPMLLHTFTAPLTRIIAGRIAMEHEILCNSTTTNLHSTTTNKLTY